MKIINCPDAEEMNNKYWCYYSVLDDYKRIYEQQKKNKNKIPETDKKLIREQQRQMDLVVKQAIEVLPFSGARRDLLEIYFGLTPNGPKKWKKMPLHRKIIRFLPKMWEFIEPGVIAVSCLLLMVVGFVAMLFGGPGFLPFLGGVIVLAYYFGSK